MPLINNPAGTESAIHYMYITHNNSGYCEKQLSLAYTISFTNIQNYTKSNQVQTLHSITSAKEHTYILPIQSMHLSIILHQNTIIQRCIYFLSFILPVSVLKSQTQMHTETHRNAHIQAPTHPHSHPKMLSVSHMTVYCLAINHKPLN